jgi:hypothetical protein
MKIFTATIAKIRIIWSKISLFYKKYLNKKMSSKAKTYDEDSKEFRSQ